MDINFYRAARPDGRSRSRSGLALLVTGAICSGLLAFFADDPEGTPRHGSGVVHLILAFIAFTCITIGAILISGRPVSGPAWRHAAPVLLAISVAVAYLLLATAGKHQDAPGGSTSASSSAWNSGGSPSPSPGRPSDPARMTRPSPGMPAGTAGLGMPVLRVPARACRQAGDGRRGGSRRGRWRG